MTKPAKTDSTGSIPTKTRSIETPAFDRRIFHLRDEFVFSGRGQVVTFTDTHPPEWSVIKTALDRAAEEVASLLARDGQQTASCVVALPVFTAGRVAEIRAVYTLAAGSVLRLEMRDEPDVRRRTRFLTRFLN